MICLKCRFEQAEDQAECRPCGIVFAPGKSPPMALEVIELFDGETGLADQFSEKPWTKFLVPL